MILEYKLDSFYKELVEEYLTNKRSELPKLEEAIEESDFATLKIIGHNLAGTGGSYGLTSLTDLGDVLENAADSEDLATCKSVTTQYSEFLSSVKIEYNS